MEKRKRKNSCSDDEDPAAVIESQGRKNRNYHLFTTRYILSEFSILFTSRTALEILKCVKQL